MKRCCTLNKTVGLSKAAAICARAKAAGKKVVLCTGSFDILHSGHAYSLEKAKSFGDLLIVGLNSDKSYRAYKDRRGPLVPEKERAALLSSISSVDYIVLFDEPDPAKLILRLKPSVYANGAYYGKDCIEAGAVRKAGARLRLIPIRKGLSTSGLIDRVAARCGEKRKAVFLDRDGVVIEDVGYPHKPSQIKFMPGIIPRLKRLQGQGYALVVITNQSGVARGYFTEAAVRRFHAELGRRLKAVGVNLLGIYYCPHHPEGKVKRYAVACACRKPRPGLIERARKEHSIDLGKSILIGDKESDLEAGRRAGVGKVELFHSR